MQYCTICHQKEVFSRAGICLLCVWAHGPIELRKLIDAATDLDSLITSNKPWSEFREQYQLRLGNLERATKGLFEEIPQKG